LTSESERRRARLPTSQRPAWSLSFLSVCRSLVARTLACPRARVWRKLFFCRGADNGAGQYRSPSCRAGEETAHLLNSTAISLVASVRFSCLAGRGGEGRGGEGRGGEGLMLAPYTFSFFYQTHDLLMLMWR
jgi:hypothetical protein